MIVIYQFTCSGVNIAKRNITTGLFGLVILLNLSILILVSQTLIVLKFKPVILLNLAILILVSQTIIVFKFKSLYYALLY
jgi:hypothetical protein